MLQRIVQGLSATLTHTFYENGVPADPSPDTVTVTVTRYDGTVLATDAAATDTGVGTVTYTLTPAQTAELGPLTVAWTATFGGQEQTFTDTVEVAGGVLFTVAQARAVRPLNDASKYTTAQIIEMRTTVEEALENACDVAFVPRAKTVTVSASGSTLGLGVNRVRSVPSITDYQGTVVDSSTTWVVGSAVVGTTAWSARPLTVRVEHGYDSPPAPVTQAALLLAKNWLVKGPIEDRATAFTTDDGTFSMSTPGVRGAIFGIPDVDSVVAQYRETAYVA